MADTLRVQFVGGPCNAQTKNVPTTLVRSGVVSCGGASYRTDPTTANPVIARYTVAAPTGASAAPNSLRGYRDLMGAVEVTLPNQLTRAAKTTRAALRRIPKRSKVR